MENCQAATLTISNPRSSILNPRISTLDLRSSIFVLQLRSQTGRFLGIRLRGRFLPRQSVDHRLPQLSRGAFESAAQVRLAVSEGPANLGGVVLIAVADCLKPSAVGKNKGLVALAALVDEDNNGHAGRQTFEELRRVLGFLALAVARQVDGQPVKTRLALELLRDLQDQSRLVRIDLLNFGHADE